MTKVGKVFIFILTMGELFEEGREFGLENNLWEVIDIEKECGGGGQEVEEFLKER